MGKKITNYERIRNMTLEEMADFLGAGMCEKVTNPCSSEFCPHYEVNGGCLGKGPDRCVPAYKAWLEKEFAGKE